MKTVRPTGSGEIWTGGVILLVIVCIAAGVFWKQFHFSPAVSLDGLSPSGSIPLETAGPPPPEGTRYLSPLETYSPDTLSEKINGKAELYLSAGFQQLECRRYGLATDRNAWFEAFFFRMDSPQNAFSVFSMQRRTDAVESDLTPFAYATANGLYFVHGANYVEMVAAQVSQPLAAAMRRAADDFVRRTPVQKATLPAADLFPQEGRRPDSIAMIAANAFGYDRFDRVFAAAYEIGGEEAELFFSRRKDTAEARELSEGYTRFLLAFGGERAEPDDGKTDVNTVFIFDTYEVIFNQGIYVAGVRGATNKASAFDLAEKLRGAIAALPDGGEP